MPTSFVISLDMLGDASTKALHASDVLEHAAVEYVQ